MPFFLSSSVSVVQGGASHSLLCSGIFRAVSCLWIIDDWSFGEKDCSREWPISPSWWCHSMISSRFVFKSGLAGQFMLFKAWAPSCLWFSCRRRYRQLCSLGLSSSLLECFVSSPCGYLSFRRLAQCCSHGRGKSVMRMSNSTNRRTKFILRSRLRTSMVSLL